MTSRRGRATRGLMWLHFTPKPRLRQFDRDDRPFLLCLLALALVSFGFGPPVITDGGYPPVRLYPDQIEKMRNAEQSPQISAAAAAVYDVDAGRTLYSYHSHEPTPPASTAKIMTALVVLQRAGLADQVAVSANAAATTGSRMGLAPGERLSVEQLLYGLLIPSGNDAAVALAEHVAGSETAFVDLMNQTAAGMHLEATRFANPHGLDVANQQVSAGDMISMTLAALKYPTFIQIVKTAKTNIAGHSLVNTNELLGAYPGADGIKTGTTDAAGECLVASASRGGHRLLVIVLGSKDRYADAKALLNFAAAGWSWRPIDLPDNALAWEVGGDGQAYRLAPDGTPDLFLPAWQWPLVQPVRVIFPGVPLTGTLPVGVLRYQFGGQLLGTVPLRVLPSP